MDKTKEFELSCEVCKSRRISFLFSNRDRMFLKMKGNFDLYQCDNCGLITIYPKPNSIKLSDHYSKNYSVYSDSGGIKYFRKIYTLLETIYHYSYVKYDLSIFLKIIHLFFIPMRSFFRTTRVIEGGNFLDVGCGVGYFLLVMKLLEMNPYGVEPGEFDENLSKEYGLKISHCDLFEANYKDAFFDVITLNHVLEHTPNPSEIMGELNRILKKEGYLIIGVPINDCLAFSVFGKRWAQIDTPRHLYIFSRNSLIMLAEKNGFEIVNIRYNSNPTYQIVCSIKYTLEKFAKKKINYDFTNNIVLNLIFLPVSAFLNLIKKGDQCEIILKKE